MMRVDRVRPGVCSTEQLMSQGSTVALQGIFLPATCTCAVWEPDAPIAHCVIHTLFQSEHGHVLI